MGQSSFASLLVIQYWKKQLIDQVDSKRQHAQTEIQGILPE